MPRNDLFSIKVLVDGQPLMDFIPKADDSSYPSQGIVKSELDRVCYVEATPGSVFTIKITYLGIFPLPLEYGYDVQLYVDGLWMDGKVFENLTEEREVMIHGNWVAEGVQP
jgi:hypothetical protein